MAERNAEYDAADTLAALATFGSANPYTPIQEQLLQASGDLDARRSSVHAPSPLGRDASNVVSSSADGDPSHAYRTDETQLREPDYIRSEPTIAQIRQPSPIASVNGRDGTALQATGGLSPYDIKPEPSVTPRAFTPGTDSLHQDSTEIGNDPGQKPSPTPGALAPTKKRGAPRSGGPLRRKPPSKRRKVDSEGADTGNDRRSNTPTSRKSRTPAIKGNKKSQSGTPVGSSPAPDFGSSDVEDGDSDEDNALYCVCRGKDDHTWMIGCEACDDWFHGRCVNLKKEEHEMLLAKFICPNCTESGRGHTTWKPMCRRDGCSRPAAPITEVKIIDGKQIEVPGRSKYCSDECGINFFKNVIAAVSRSNGPAKRRSQYKRRTIASDDDLSEDDYEPPPRGGVLRARDLKSLVSAADTVEMFYGLGSGILSPPASESGPLQESDRSTNTASEPLSYTLNEVETERLAETASEKTQVRDRGAMLKDRERFITFSRESATRHAEKNGLKPKELCGYDSRLAWSEKEFQIWRTGQRGRAAFAAGTSEPTEEDIVKFGEEDPSGSGEEEDPSLDVDAIRNGIPQPCVKKRCTAHKDWEKIHREEIRFTAAQAAQVLRRLESEERDIHQKAMLRWRKEKAMESLNDHDPDSKRHGEGWVEMVS